jgi:DNA-binding transcriptional regulator YhcF (GntR family)
MEWNFENGVPIYLQLMDGFRQAIARGEYPPGEKLPAVRDLAVEAGVNPNTMQRALAELEREGLVYSMRTSGRFVTEDTKVLESLRRELSDACFAAMYEKLTALGMSETEIREALDRWLQGHAGA